MLKKAKNNLFLCTLRRTLIWSKHKETFILSLRPNFQTRLFSPCYFPKKSQASKELPRGEKTGHECQTQLVAAAKATEKLREKGIFILVEEAKKKEAEDGGCFSISTLASVYSAENPPKSSFQTAVFSASKDFLEITMFENPSKKSRVVF